MRKLLSLLALICALCVAALAQDTPGTVKYPGAIDSQCSLFAVKDAPHARLMISIGVSDTSITVDDTSSFPACGSIKIDSEVIYYSSKTSTIFTVTTRGADSTASASHVSGAAVSSPIIAAHHNALASAIIATQTKVNQI